MRCQTLDSDAEMTEDSVMEVDVGMALAMMEMGGVWFCLGFDGIEENKKNKKKKKKKEKVSL